MRRARHFYSRGKQVFLFGFSLTFPTFPCKSKNRLNTSLLICWKENFFIVFISFFNLIKAQVKKFFLRMLFKVTGGLPWSSFKFYLFVILMKSLFIIEASCFSSETNSPFSLSNILFEFNSLLLKYGLMVFRNLLLSDKSFKFRFWKYSFFVLRRSVTQKFRCF